MQKRCCRRSSRRSAAQPLCSVRIPSEFMDVRRCTSSMGSVDQRTAWFRRLIFFEVRNAAAPAFKCTYIGQCAETLRPSNQSHVLSSGSLGRALCIHDATNSARFIRGSIGFLYLVEWKRLAHGQKLRENENRWHTPPLQTSEPPVSSPALERSLRAHRHGDVQRRPACCMGLITNVSLRRCRQSGKVSKLVSSCVALRKIRRTC